MIELPCPKYDSLPFVSHGKMFFSEYPLIFPLFSKAFLWKIAEVKKATTEVIAFFFASKPIISKPSEEPHQSLPETSFLPL